MELKEMRLHLMFIIIFVFQSHLYGIERAVAVDVRRLQVGFNRTFMELKDESSKDNAA